ncbi:hypothetical protein D9M72_576980 [compost metagenome]
MVVLVSSMFSNATFFPVLWLLIALCFGEQNAVGVPRGRPANALRGVRVRRGSIRFDAESNLAAKKIGVVGSR